MNAAFVPKQNGSDFTHSPGVGTPIPEPEEELLGEKVKVYDAGGHTYKKHPTMTPTKNPNIIQIPQWAATTFGTFILVIGFYAVSFYNQTNNEIKNLTEKYNALNSAVEEKRRQETQEMMNNAVKRGYELKAAEDGHGPRSGGK